jgi:processive 1,2-diacylglycerol beta-glucosyltransferase
VVLVGTGSQGIGLSERRLQDFLERLLAKFNRIGLKVKIFVVCGKNAKLAARLKANLNHEAISVLGFFTPMARLYRIADVFVTKPGGLSITEALSYQLPCALLYSLPGQEELNIDYLQRASLILPPLSRRQGMSRLILQVVEEVRTGDFRRVLRKNPQSAAVVKTQLPDEVLQLLRS